MPNLQIKVPSCIDQLDWHPEERYIGVLEDDQPRRFRIEGWHFRNLVSHRHHDLLVADDRQRSLSPPNPPNNIDSDYELTKSDARYIYIHVSVHRRRFLLNNQPHALIIPILFCYETLHFSGIFSAHHQEFSTVHSSLVSFMQVFDDRFQAESGWNFPPPNGNKPTPGIQSFGQNLHNFFSPNISYHRVRHQVN
jgi:hypothetical protein